MALNLSRYCLVLVLLNYALFSNAAQLPAFPLVWLMYLEFRHFTC